VVDLVMPVPSSAPTGSPEPTAPGRVATRVVIDTSVLISDPEAVFAFPAAAVVIPLTVVEELDSLKARLDDVGRSAREVLRRIEALRVANGGDIRSAVALPGGGTLEIETNGLLLDTVVAAGLDPAKADNRILAAALGQVAAAGGGTVELVSNDAALRIKAAQVGLVAHEHHRGGADPGASRRTGWATVEVAPTVIDDLYARDGAALDDLPVPGAVGPNEYAVLRAGQQSVLVRRRGDRLAALHRGQEAWGVRPRAKEQQFALDLLLDPEVRIVALDGYAGTGKTILALAAGLEQVIERPRYDKVAVYRPVVPVGKSELGFLPGTLAEKLDPWMQAVTDAIVAMTERRSHADAVSLLDELGAREKLSMETVTFLRGRSLLGTFVLVDEAQNLEPTTLKTILTRVGEGTKIVFTGDTSQIDAPYLSEHTNAIAVLIDAFAGQDLFGHVRLSHCERSEVASLAATLL
jgi:PhoH-like ATPase